MARYRRAVLGGTFDRLHLGHEALLATAFRVGRTVAIGLTTERYLAAHPKPDGRSVQPYTVRRRRLSAWLRQHARPGSWRVVGIDEPFGGSVAPGVGVLVVSADTVGGGRAVNVERRRRGLPRVPLVIVPLALADDLQPIASRRIRAGVIDRDGHRRSRIRVQLRVSARADAIPATRAVKTAFPRAVLARSGLPRGRPETQRTPVAAELTVEVRRHPDGWTVIEGSPAVRLRPRKISGTRPRDLVHGLRTLLRPSSAPAPGESF